MTAIPAENLKHAHGAFAEPTAFTVFNNNGPDGHFVTKGSDPASVGLNFEGIFGNPVAVGGNTRAFAGLGLDEDLLDRLKTGARTAAEPKVFASAAPVPK